MIARMVTRLRTSNERIISTSLGIVYFWFGLLKFFPGSSPAEELAKQTINMLTFGIIPGEVSYLMLAIWETALGVLLILPVRRRWIIYAALVHMICTFTPLFMFPEMSFQSGGSLTLTGQYIIKNLIIIAALVSIFPADQHEGLTTQDNG